jgi:hypothetical protein
MNSRRFVISSRLRRLVAGFSSDSASGERRDHDLAMSDPHVALEHQIQIGRAISRGGSGCTFCS